MSTDLLELAIASTRGVLAGVSSSQLRDPTPCTKWSVGQLITHIVADQFFFVGVVAGEVRSDEPPNYSDGSFLSTFDAGSGLCVEAFSYEGVMREEFSLPSGPVTGFALVRIATTDTFVHGWDLARATDQSTDLSPDLAVMLLVAAKVAIPAIVRSESGSPFALERSAPSGASEADRLAAYLGRGI